MKSILPLISAIVVVLGGAGCATQHGAAPYDAQAPSVHQFYGSKVAP